MPLLRACRGSLPSTGPKSERSPGPRGVPHPERLCHDALAAANVATVLGEAPGLEAGILGGSEAWDLGHSCQEWPMTQLK
mmetsp:Transcript_5059/g.7159  ORF Transcript_5059/g.7159 Transcript_5059/m.7159 type:complete len:80 (-) Transcript_5059:84-323(-)